MILEYEKQTKENKFFTTKRSSQNQFWLLQTIEDRLKSNFFEKSIVKSELSKQLKLIEEHKTTPFAAAEYLLNL